MLKREGVIIDCGMRVRGQTSGFTPPVPTNKERYRQYKDKALRLNDEIEENAFRWNFKPAKQSTLKARRSARKAKRIMETVAV